MTTFPPEEIARLRALCEAATPSSHDQFSAAHAAFESAARAALPAALNEIERLHEALNKAECARVLDHYGMQDGSLLRDLRSEIERLEHENAELAAALHSERDRCIARSSKGSRTTQTLTPGCGSSG